MSVKNCALAAAGVLVLAAAISLVVPGSAVAQAVQAALMRDVDNPAFQPFQAATSGRIFRGGYQSSVIAQVADGKRLVIEYVSAWITDFTDSAWALEIDTVQKGAAERHMIPVAQEMYVFGGYHLIAAQPTRLYADPGSAVTVAVSRSGLVGASDVSFTVSGHLVDLE